ncbi:MAG: glycosyltransferase family 39 protein [Deltaproteobacteria bacterium]|nr:glycosyltransferase family 39 protein [Deltaproteobacteria bacterium]
MNQENTQPKTFSVSLVNRWLNILTYGLASLTVIYLLFWITPAILKRLFFLGELEHQEGLTAYTLWFLKRGGNIYQKPDIHFAGSIYGPLYYYAASLFTQLTDLSLQSLRIFSLICIFGTAICVFLLMRFYGLNRFLSCLWLPIYFAYWSIQGWIDIARLEAFFMFTLFLGITFFNTAIKKSYRYFLAGLVIGLSISTKQTGILFLLLVIPEFYKNRTFFFAGGALLSLLCVESLSFLKFGWDMYAWRITVPSHQSVDLVRGFLELSKHLLIQERGLLMASVLCCVLTLTNSKLKIRNWNQFISENSQLLLIAFETTIALISVFICLAKQGGGLFNIALFNAFLSLLAIYSIGYFLKTENSIHKFIMTLSLGVILFSELQSIRHGLIKNRTPTSEDEADYKKIVDIVRLEPGQAWVTNHPWISVLAGKIPYVPMQQAGCEWAGEFLELSPSIVEAIENKKFELILTGDDWMFSNSRDKYFNTLERNYQKSNSLSIPYLRSIDAAALGPRVGWIRK